MQIRQYTHYNDDEILNLYTLIGWTNYTRGPAMLKHAYANSLCIFGAYEEDALVGIIRAVGDGYSVVFIQDIIIHPDFRRQGIGTALIKAVLDEYAHVYQIELMTDSTPKTIAFYKSLGFAPANELGCTAFMKIKHRE